MDPIIEFKNLDIYQKNILVLSAIDLTIYPGEFVYLTGKTGTGKTSLMKIMYADLPAKGDLANMAGLDLLKLKTKQIPKLRRKLGIVFQDFQLLYDRTVFDNLMFVMRATGWKDRNKMQERINSVLETVSLGTKGFKMPHQLSGGEQQRVCIARALINDPEIILADEPTGNLDPETSIEIMEVLHNIVNKSGRTIIMASHDYNMIEKYPSRTILCEGGSIIDPGTDFSKLKMVEKKVVAPEEITPEEKATPEIETSYSDE
ncbi:MAG: ATP-binding cassette domain-containing protein [Bacteroidales bacterium]|nr:ATP-binding cassette domain-containing protein [Bacteroidales bacterium]